MNKKIIALILIVPFVFLFLMFSASHAVALAVDVPVTGIEITNELESKTKPFDLANYNNDFYLKVKIMPERAKNQEYITVIEKVDDGEFAQIEIDKSGLVIPRTGGKARITVMSNDGGFKDSIIAVVWTTKPLSMDSISIQDFMRQPVDITPAEGQYDYTASIETGRYYFAADCKPPLSDISIAFNSSDANKAQINRFAGFADIVSSGEVVISAETQGAFGLLKKTVLLKVKQMKTPSGITVNGVNSANIFVEKSKQSVRCIVEAESGLSQQPKLSGDDMQYLQSHSFTKIDDGSVSTHKYALDLNFVAGKPPEVKFEITIGTASYNLTVEFGNLMFEVFDMPYYQTYEDSYVQYAERSIDYYVLATPDILDAEYIWTFDVLQAAGKNAPVELSVANEKCTIKALSAGKVTVYVMPYKDGEPLINEPLKFNILIINNVTSTEFAVNTVMQWGTTDYPVFGDKTLDENGKNYIDYKNRFDINVFENVTQKPNFDLSSFIFSSSNPAVAAITIENNIPYLKILSTGFVDLTVTWKYSNLKVAAIKSVTSIECVKDAVNIFDYDGLVKAAEDGKKIILGADIALGMKKGMTPEKWKLLDDKELMSQLKSMTKTMPTTYSWKYHENMGYPQPDVYYCIEFKNNVYGNGHYINGEYITTAKDKAGVPMLFNGPVSYVDAPSLASAKGQDNIVFLVRTDNVVIDNVMLWGCSDEAITPKNEQGDESLDLSRLHKTGTVLEIMANVTVLNSRIKNGRNCIRTYGGNKYTPNPIVKSVAELDAGKERIVVNIESCIITQAREFLIKLGSNNVLLGGKSKNSPNLQLKNEAGKLTDVSHKDEKTKASDAFYQQLVLTDVTVKNCVLSTSGLFAIGIDTNYSGPVLSSDLSDKFEQFKDLFVGWYDLGGTSFASVLRLEGDVRFYDWKLLRNMDSSTLVEVFGAEGYLDINLADMVNKAINVKGGGYRDIIYNKNAEQYINTSIMMFGGGKNYSRVIDDNFEGEALTPYLINVDILMQEYAGEDPDIYDKLANQGRLIPLVVGYEDFEFLLYNVNSTNNYEKQLSDFASGDAYSWFSAASRNDKQRK